MTLSPRTIFSEKSIYSNKGALNYIILSLITLKKYECTKWNKTTWLTDKTTTVQALITNTILCPHSQQTVGTNKINIFWWNMPYCMKMRKYKIMSTSLKKAEIKAKGKGSFCSYFCTWLSIFSGIRILRRHICLSRLYRFTCTSFWGR